VTRPGVRGECTRRRELTKPSDGIKKRRFRKKSKYREEKVG